MPTISRFHGISIRMYAGEREHPPLHFRAYFGAREMRVNIETGLPLTGDLPAAQIRMVLQWAEQHRSVLITNWELARNNKAPNAVPPLH